MKATKFWRELRLIHRRLDSVEEALVGEMTAADERALEEALEGHKQWEAVPFSKAREH